MSSVSNKKPTDEETRSESSTDIVASWSESEEKLLKGTSERCNCMRWLHTQCNLYFDSMNFYLTIPNVIISTLNGSFTMALPSLFPDPGSQKSATTIIGLISILSAVMITMNQYIKCQQMTEAHRTTALAYGKLYRVILNELSIRRDQRTNGMEFMKKVRSEIDRIENTSPSIMPFIIKKFGVQFANRNIEKPEIAGDLDEVEINHELRKRAIRNLSPKPDEFDDKTPMQRKPSLMSVLVLKDSPKKKALPPPTPHQITPPRTPPDTPPGSLSRKS
jgi:hypothetical protein